MIDDNEMSKREEEHAIAEDAKRENMKPMKASELIVKLQTAIAEHGDLNCIVQGDATTDADVSNIVICESADGDAKQFLIADRETELAFS